jgi:hypothetical protein
VKLGEAAGQVAVTRGDAHSTGDGGIEPGEELAALGVVDRLQPVARLLAGRGRGGGDGAAWVGIAAEVDQHLVHAVDGPLHAVPHDLQRRTELGRAGR